MRFSIRLILAIVVLALTACADASGGAQGGGSELGGRGQVKVGMPF
jgi:hypothetical protein